MDNQEPFSWNLSAILSRAGLTVVETKTREELNQKTNRYKTALETIRKHNEMMGANLGIYLGSWRIAQQALNKEDTSIKS